MRNKFIDVLISLANKDRDVMLITGDLGFGVVEKFYEAHPTQFLNVGVSEQSMIGVAAGLASENKKIFIYSIANFPTFRCLEQIRNDICYHGFPVTIVAVGAGISYSKLGYTHHAIEDISIMRPLPNLNIFSPGTIEELELSMLEIYTNQKPNYLRIGQISVWNDKADLPKINGSLSFQQGGFDALIITTSSLLGECQKIKNKLLIYGKNITLASAYKLKPFNVERQFLEQFRVVITIEEHSIIGGLGSIINDYIIQNDLNIRILNFGINENVSSTFGEIDYMRKAYSIDHSSILEMLKEKILANKL